MNCCEYQSIPLTSPVLYKPHPVDRSSADHQLPKLMLHVGESNSTVVIITSHSRIGLVAAGSGYRTPVRDFCSTRIHSSPVDCTVNPWCSVSPHPMTI